MKDRLPIVIVAVAAVLVLAIVVRMRLNLVSPPPPIGVAQPVTEDAGTKHDYSARVEERLRLLRSEHERRERVDNARDADDAHDADETVDASKRARQGSAPGAQGATDDQPASRRHGSHLDFPVPNAPVGQSFGELKHTLTSHPSREKRIEAAQEIGASEEPDALSVLVEALNDRDPEVRAAVVAAMGDNIEDLTLEMLMPALKDSDANVRFEAVTLLGFMEAPDAMDILRSLVEDPDADVRDLAEQVRHVLETQPTPFPVITPPRWHPPRLRRNHPR